MEAKRAMAFPRRTATVLITVSITNTAPATDSLNPSYSMATYTLLPFCRPG